MSKPLASLLRGMSCRLETISDLSDSRAYEAGMTGVNDAKSNSMVSLRVSDTSIAGKSNMTCIE